MIIFAWFTQYANNSRWDYITEELSFPRIENLKGLLMMDTWHQFRHSDHEPFLTHLLKTTYKHKVTGTYHGAYRGELLETEKVMADFALVVIYLAARQKTQSSGLAM
jgi:hypothetical protein